MTALWRIQGSKTYVLGSVHATNIDPLQLPRHIEHAFSISERVVFEADLDGVPDQSLLVLPANRVLPDVLPAAIYAATLAHWQRLGLPEARLQTAVPGLAAMTLQLAEAGRHGYSPAFGIDRRLWQRATAEGKTKDVLESFDDQLRKLVESPIEEQVSLLDYITVAPDVRVSELAGMVSAWIAGNMAHFERLYSQRVALWPKTFEVLISQRNQNWLPAMLEMARNEEPNFVIVGLLHLFGPTGLAELLRKNGLSLAREDA